MMESLHRSEEKIIQELSEWEYERPTYNTFMDHMVWGIISNFPQCCIHDFCLDSLINPKMQVDMCRREDTGYDGHFRAWDQERWVLPRVTPGVSEVEPGDKETTSKGHVRRPGWTNYVPCRHCAKEATKIES